MNSINIMHLEKHRPGLNIITSKYMRHNAPQVDMGSEDHNQGSPVEKERALKI